MNPKTFSLIVISLFFFKCLYTKSSNSEQSKNEKLVGIWGISTDANASFQIKKDSIYYPEYFKSYGYKTSKDSIFVNFDNYIFKAKYGFANDSLVFKSGDKKTSFVRFQSH